MHLSQSEGNLNNRLTGWSIKNGIDIINFYLWFSIIANLSLSMCCFFMINKLEKLIEYQ